MFILKEEIKCLVSKRTPTFLKDLTPQRDSPTSIKNITLQGDSKNIIRVKEKKNIFPLINVIIVIRWDTLLRIVLPKGKNSRIEIRKYIIPMQLKMMSHPRSLLKKKLNIMSCRYLALKNMIGTLMRMKDVSCVPEKG
jgi:hypothetical protein